MSAIRGAIQEIAKYAVEYGGSPSGQDCSPRCRHKSCMDAVQAAVGERTRLPQADQAIDPREQVDERAGQTAGS